MTRTGYNKFSFISVLITLALTLTSLYSQVMDKAASEAKDQNILAGISKEHMGGLQWVNEPAEYSIRNGELFVTATKGTDFFINPEDLSNSASAALLFKEVTGDFVAIACVSPDMSSVWNAGGLLVLIDDDNWIKFVFEYSDATGPSVVTVTTRGISDDANGERLTDHSKIWLKLARKGNNYAMHWSEDGIKYKMARLSAMSPAGLIKIGLEAQCPVGESARHSFQHFSIESKTVQDLRKGE